MKTLFKERILHMDTATELYDYLKNEVKWEDGIRSRKGFTRKAKSVDTESKIFIELSGYLNIAYEGLTGSSLESDYFVLGIYLNYYENGEMYTPNHSHPGTQQLILSLGATRTLNVGKKSFNMSNGSAILFGSAVHGVKKEKVNDGRISIATFMVPRNTLLRF